MGRAFDSIRPIHFDVLREISNIGSGNAITALSKMLNKTVRMKVPRINLLDFKDVSGVIGNPESIIIGILVNVSGDVNGIMMFLVEEQAAHTMINILLNKEEENEESEFTEIELSALTEIGNILCSSYLGSLSSLINKSITPSVPYLAIDMAGAILSVPAIEFGKISDKVLFIESVFAAEGKNVSGFFLLVPDLPSFNLILSSLGVM